MTNEELTELEAVLAKMTGGKWWPRYGGEPGRIYSSARGLIAEVPHEHSDAVEMNDTYGIVALRNAAPVLLAAARREASAREDCRRAERQRDDLLAIIFRDGGQRAGALGDKAVEEAHKEWAAVVSQLDELLEALRPLATFGIGTDGIVYFVTKNDCQRAADAIASIEGKSAAEPRRASRLTTDELRDRLDMPLGQSRRPD